MLPLIDCSPVGIVRRISGSYSGVIATMKRPACLAFTLIELLVVLGIIAVLASIAFPIFGNVMLSAKRTQSMSNMRQLGAAFVSYCNDNNGQVPLTGNTPTSWTDTADCGDATAWFNVLPRNYANSKGLGDYTNDPADFYAKGSLFYVPAAKYPTTGTSAKLTVPLFAVSINSKLYGTIDTKTIDATQARLQNFVSLAETCIFQESGLPGETTVVTGQNVYTNQCKTYASRSVARYSGRTIIVFADGHADSLLGTDIVSASTKKAYYPQVGTAGGSVYWTMDPTINANN